MQIYRLPVSIRPPALGTEDKYLAEIPLLPGCRAWGDTITEALAMVQSVAAAFIASYQERGDPLPGELTDRLSVDNDLVIESELLVSA